MGFWKSGVIQKSCDFQNPHFLLTVFSQSSLDWLTNQKVVFWNLDWLLFKKSIATICNFNQKSKYNHSMKDDNIINVEVQNCQEEFWKEKEKGPKTVSGTNKLFKTIYVFLFWKTCWYFIFWIWMNQGVQPNFLIRTVGK